MMTNRKPTLTTNPKLPAPRCARYEGRVYVRGCDCASCVERKAFHRRNQAMRKAQVAAVRPLFLGGIPREETKKHSCDEGCRYCPQCYRASGLEICGEVCEHREEEA